MDTIPSQNDGVAMPAIATVRTTWSIQLFCFSAEMVPSGIAMSDGDHCRHHGDLERDRQRAAISSATGLPDHIEMPKSRREKSHDKVDELQDQRTLESELGVTVGDGARIDVAAAGAKADHADVARDQSHQHEHERRRPDQGRDRQAAAGSGCSGT